MVISNLISVYQIILYMCMVLNVIRFNLIRTFMVLNRYLLNPRDNCNFSQYNFTQGPRKLLTLANILPPFRITDYQTKALGQSGPPPRH